MILSNVDMSSMPGLQTRPIVGYDSLSCYSTWSYNKWIVTEYLTTFGLFHMPTLLFIFNPSEMTASSYPRKRCFLRQSFHSIGLSPGGPRPCHTIHRRLYSLSEEVVLAFSFSARHTSCHKTIVSLPLQSRYCSLSIVSLPSQSRYC